MTAKPRILVLTGSIGMGKSTTAKMFAEFGVPVWDADASVADLYAEGGAAVPMVTNLAPVAVTSGKVDRKALRKAISEDPELLRRIEAAVHPLVARDREDFIAKNRGEKLIILDIPLYFEISAKLDAEVLVVTASEEVQRKRVLARGTMSEGEFEMIKARQMPDIEKRDSADHVIETLSLEQTRQEVQTLVEKLKAE